MIPLGIVVVALAMSAAAGAAHAEKAIETFPALAGAGAHDVCPAPDGTVWFTAQRAGKLGSIPGPASRI